MLTSGKKVVVLIVLAAAMVLAASTASASPNHKAGKYKCWGICSRPPAAAQVPIKNYDWDPNYPPQAGGTLDYFIDFNVKKTMRVRWIFLVPDGVTVVVKGKPQPTSWYQGDPVWNRKVCRCARVSVELELTFDSNLQSGQAMVMKVRFSARHYRPWTLKWGTAVY